MGACFPDALQRQRRPAGQRRYAPNGHKGVCGQRIWQRGGDSARCYAVRYGGVHDAFLVVICYADTPLVEEVAEVVAGDLRGGAYQEGLSVVAIGSIVCIGLRVSGKHALLSGNTVQALVKFIAKDEEQLLPHHKAQYMGA